MFGEFVVHAWGLYEGLEKKNYIIESQALFKMWRGAKILLTINELMPNAICLTKLHADSEHALKPYRT